MTYLSDRFLLNIDKLQFLIFLIEMSDSGCQCVSLMPRLKKQKIVIKKLKSVVSGKVNNFVFH